MHGRQYISRKCRNILPFLSYYRKWKEINKRFLLNFNFYLLQDHDLFIDREDLSRHNDHGKYIVKYFQNDTCFSSFVKSMYLFLYPQYQNMLYVWPYVFL